MGFHHHDWELPLCLQTSGSHLHGGWLNSLMLLLVAAKRRVWMHAQQFKQDITAMLLIASQA